MALYALPMAALNAGGAFLEKKVALSVRTILFDRLNDKYTEAKLARFYRLALPDSDSQEGVTSAPQTLTTELSLLSDELVHHVGHLISPCMNIVYLSVVLRRSLGSAPLLCYLGYFCIATALIERVKKGSAKACGGTLAAAIAEGQQLESELRERCSKVHNNREEIAMLRGGKCEGVAIKGRFYSLMRHLYLQWGAHAVVDCAREFLLQHGGSLMGYMVMVPTLYMATQGGAAGAAASAALEHGHSHGAPGVHAHGASGFSRGRFSGATRGGLSMRGVHGDHSHGNSMESPLALLFGAGNVDDHDHDDHSGHSHGGVGDIAEMMVANGQLLASLAGSILELSETYKCGSIVRGLSRRIKTMESKMDELTTEIPGSQFVSLDDSSESFEITHLNVAAPLAEDAGGIEARRAAAAAGEGSTTELLIDDFNLVVKRGQHTLVRGRNGVGKTSLFRTISGLWEPASSNSSGAPLTLPKDMLFVPQKTYLTDGTLREQLAYPDALADVVDFGDDKAEALLNKVGLEGLLARYSLDTPEEWETVLSGGEKQRLAWARLFLRRPRFALLDEASAGVSVDKLEDLYTTATDYGITLVTISHEPAVQRFHSQTVELKGKGEWEIIDTAEADSESLSSATSDSEGAVASGHVHKD